MRLIDADKLRLSYWVSPTSTVSTAGQYYFYSQAEINNAPTIDAEPVVRCKDCKYVIPYESGGFNCLTCPNVDRDVDENWFCAYGERKTEVKKNED